MSSPRVVLTGVRPLQAVRRAPLQARRTRDHVVRSLLSLAIRRLERSMNGRSPVGPFIPTDALAGLRALEENWTAIRLELDAISVRRADLPNFQDISADQRPITDDDHWKTYFFYGYGHRFTGNCARCPQTAELLDHVPGLTTAFFSILGPHKHVPEHRGPYKGVIRYHLALRIPRPWEASGIRVGSQTAHWEEGKAIAFDDTYPHEAWNGTAEDRTVLFLDIVRPLPFPHSWLNRFVIWGIARSPFVRDAKRNHDSWERKFVRPGLDDRKGCPR